MLWLIWLAKSGGSVLILLGLYRLLLEKQVMHQLKRLYLLGTLLIAVALPFVEVRLPADALPVAWLPPLHLATDLLPVDGASQPSIAHERLADVPAIEHAGLTADGILGGLYGLVTLLMLIRFGRNLHRLAKQVRQYSSDRMGEARLVRVPGAGLPYAFLHYLFVPDDPYSRGAPEPELLTHELTHIRQRHSIDILLMESALCFGWVNPLLFKLKQAMQLNHEFLADQAVTTKHGDVPGYQHLLLSKLISAPLPLTSTLTFQTTKKRLLMMTKPSSPARQWLAAGSATLLFGTLIFVMTVRTVAQQPVAKPAVMMPSPTRPTRSPLTLDEMERRFGDREVQAWTGEKIQRIRYRDLTPVQKKLVKYLPPPARIEPTEAQWNDWQNTKKYGLWIDGKRRRDNPLGRQYKRADIVFFWSSYIHKNARQPEGYLYQLDLYTEPAYQEMVKRMEENPLLVIRREAQSKEAKEVK